VCSKWFHAHLKSCVTRQTDSVLMMHPYNRRDIVECHLFAQILAICRAINSTNPIRQVYTTTFIRITRVEGHCLIGLVDLIAQLSAMILAKSLIVSKKKKTNLIIAHLCSETEFLVCCIPSNFIDRSDTQDQCTDKYIQFNRIPVISVLGEFPPDCLKLDVCL
jgi:hypothetical protein